MLFSQGRFGAEDMATIRILISSRVRAATDARVSCEREMQPGRIERPTPHEIACARHRIARSGAARDATPRGMQESADGRNAVAWLFEMLQAPDLRPPPTGDAADPSPRAAALQVGSSCATAARASASVCACLVLAAC